MPRPIRRALVILFLVKAFTGQAQAQTVLTWDDVKDLFHKNNPTLLAGQLGIQKSQASEITAALRPNPIFTTSNDQFLIFSPSRLSALNNAQWTQTVQQLIERRNKRGLRTDSARLATAIATTDQLDLERGLIFGLRDAFIRVLQSKSLLELATENIHYYDKALAVNRDRFKAGDIAQVDLTRLELQRAQFESDLENTRVSLRTAKIALLSMLNDRRPIDDFDVRGEFSYHDLRLSLEEARNSALDARPDLKSAASAVNKARVDNKLAWANGSTDPVVGLEYQRTPSDPTGNNTMGFNISIPLRIFDRNQGEKARTAIEINRTERVRDAVLIAIYRDVDSAYAITQSVRTLLLSYQDQYLAKAAEARDTVSFAYSKGGASLLEFLDAQKAYRDTELQYRNLIASYLAAVNQLNLAVGREVIQ